MTARRAEKQPVWQWLSLMITIIGGMFGGYYTLDKRISLIEQRNDVKDKQFEAMQNTLTTGMQLRIELQKDVQSWIRTVGEMKTENQTAHENIMRILERLYGYKQVSSIPTEPDFIQ